MLQRRRGGDAVGDRRSGAGLQPGPGGDGRPGLGARWRLGGRPLWQETVAAFKAGDFDKVVEIGARTWLAGPSRSLEDVDPDLLALFTEMDRAPTATESERDEYVVPLEPPTNEQLDRIDVPALVIVGEHDLPDLIESAHYLAGRLSEEPALVMENTAHLPSLERPDEFNEVLSGFLASP